MRNEVYVKFAEALQERQLAKQASVEEAIKQWQVEKTAEIDEQIRQLELEKEAMKTPNIRFLRNALRAGRAAAVQAGGKSDVKGVIKSVLNAKQLQHGGADAAKLLGNTKQNFPVTTGGAALDKFIAALGMRGALGANSGKNGVSAVNRIIRNVGGEGVRTAGGSKQKRLGMAIDEGIAAGKNSGNLGKILTALGITGAGAGTAGIIASRAGGAAAPVVAQAAGGADKRLLAALAGAGLLTAGGVGAYAMSGSKKKDDKAAA